MERKRKLPARAAARVDHVTKKRNVSPPERSVTPAPASLPTPTPAPAEAIPEEPQLPRSVQAGNPLPTVEAPQPEDLPAKDYQSIQESSVLAESLSRSRQKWIHDGIFEKYWSKPTKRKGVVKEDPGNPAKDTMMKIGQVTITVEPHVFEATMYAVKDPRPAVPTTNSTFRPVLQYGPPNGVMPPPPKPHTPSTPSAVPPPTSQTPALPSQPPSQPPATRPVNQPAQPPSQPPVQPQIQPPVVQPPAPQPDSQRLPPAATASGKPLASPRGLESVLARPQPSPAPIGPPHTATPQPNGPTQPAMSTSRPLHAPSPVPTAPGVVSALPPGAKQPTPAPKPATPTQPGADPIIVTLAEKASEDPHLRDLMKRVAVGDAAPHELQHFQRIIDQITNDYKKKGGQQGPSADRVLVDGKSVKYFADEVRDILDIVLTSNPQQRGSDLKAPRECDALVTMLVRKALDEPATRDLVRRIAVNKTKFHDATDLQSILDKLKRSLTTGENSKTQQGASSVNQAAPENSPGATPATNGTANGTPSRKSSLVANAPTPQQALRSKGPPPTPKPDISAIVLEFPGGTGDRYLFPKYSILEYPEQSQVIASFLIVRKGSQLEYGGDPALDYYQPVTIRLSSHSGKHLENLARVVAPPEEVRRYMDDIMDNMTRAEYLLLAMRLPRAETDDHVDEPSANPRAELQGQPQQPGVLWTTKAAAVPAASSKPVAKPSSNEEQYQNFISTVS